MRKQSMIRKGMSVLCVCALAAGLCSCGTEEKSEEEKILRVVADGRLYKKAEAAAGFTEGTNSEIEVEIQQLPEKKEERENEIQKLRTEIMAGKGPDVYLLDGNQENGEEFLPLLENPYQTMQSGALASLDEFMEKDSYWEDNTYHEAILKEGQYDGRQYIIPMSVMYYVLPRTEDMEEMTGDTLGEWVEQVANSEDVRLKKYFITLMSQGARWIQPAADYESGEVLFDQKKWCEFADKFIRFGKAAQEELALVEEHYFFENGRAADKNEKVDLQIVPDIDGRKMASIMSYAAVGMSSDLKQEAYDYLMLFLNDQTKQYNKEHPDIRLPEFYGYLSHIGNVPVQESAFEVWMGYPDDEVLQETINTFCELDGTYFLTSAERTLFTEASDICSEAIYSDYDWTQALPKAADSAWNTYKMMVSE